MTPEAKARQTIDALLTAAGWHVCSMAEANIHASIGVAIREFPLKNLVMEYGHAQVVVDGVNVNYDVYRIKTEVSEQGSKVDKGFWLETRDKATRRKTAWQLDDDFEYQSEELDRAVQTPDQIRTVIRALRDVRPRKIFPGRTVVSRTRAFARADTCCRAS